MAYLDESNADWNAGIYQIETTDSVIGGSGGIANRQALELAKRTRDLKDNKVDKVTGKQLSTNDYTSIEKTKLANIAEGANKYIHPSSHLAAMIVESSEKQFVSENDKNKWNSVGITDLIKLTDSDGNDKLRLVVTDGKITNKYYYTQTAFVEGIENIIIQSEGSITVTLEYHKDAETSSTCLIVGTDILTSNINELIAGVPVNVTFTKGYNQGEFDLLRFVADGVLIDSISV